MKRSRQRGLWFLLAIVISTGVYSIIRYGLRPKPVPVMNATQFEDLQQIGAVVYKRLRQEVHAERLILLGSAAELPEYANMWTGFLKAAMADGIRVEQFYQEDGIQAPENVGGWPVTTLNANRLRGEDFIGEIKTHLMANRLVLLHGLNVEVSHLRKDSVVHALEEAAHHPVLSLSSESIALAKEDLEHLHDDCVEPSVNTKPEGDGEKRMACTKARVARAILRKHPEPGQIWSVIERHGLKEYLVFVHRAPPKAN